MPRKNKPSKIDHLPPEVQRAFRDWSAKGGRNGSRAAKVAAGKAGGEARWKPIRERRLKRQQAKEAVQSVN